MGQMGHKYRIYYFLRLIKAKNILRENTVLNIRVQFIPFINSKRKNELRKSSVLQRKALKQPG